METYLGGIAKGNEIKAISKKEKQDTCISKFIQEKIKNQPQVKYAKTTYIKATTLYRFSNSESI